MISAEVKGIIVSTATNSRATRQAQPAIEGDRAPTVAMSKPQPNETQQQTQGDSLHQTKI